MAKRKILCVYDNGGKTFDRYTIVLPRSGRSKDGQSYPCISLSFNPEHPQGFSQFGECIPGGHLGKKVSFGSLPRHIRKHVKRRVA